MVGIVCTTEVYAFGGIFEVVGYVRAEFCEGAAQVGINTAF